MNVHIYMQESKGKIVIEFFMLLQGARGRWKVCEKVWRTNLVRKRFLSSNFCSYGCFILCSGNLYSVSPPILLCQCHRQK